MLRVLRLGSKLARIVWASPYSLLGLLIGVASQFTGGHGRFRDGAFEFYGGFATWFVRHLPTGIHTAGFTLGHVILGQADEGLVIVGRHERVHVRQYEVWGPFMGRAYLL